MLNYKNIDIIGTSHISPQSLREVESYISLRKPQIVALELDMGRLRSLFSEEKSGSFSPFKYGFKGFIFAKLAHYVEHSLGGKTGVKPGSEMKLAYTLAQKNGLKVSLIDQDIRVTLQRLKISWKEKWNFVADIFKGGFQYLFNKKALLTFDISKVPPDQMIEKLIIEMKDKYPNIHQVLVEERNQYMAKKLFVLMRKNPESQILAVVGAGHGKDMIDIIKTLDRE
jgi:pheromone shutdown protein TraB